MTEGEIVLAAFRQSDGSVKNRPALILRVMRPFGDLLVCGISRQLRHEVGDFDEIIAPGDADFLNSGLMGASLIRLGFLAALPPADFLGQIGGISKVRHRRMLGRLADYLTA